mgnify:CR=1 FL=1
MCGKGIVSFSVENALWKRQLSTFVLAIQKVRKAQKNFSIPQPTETQSVATEIGKFPKNFPKISSPKIWSVSKKSVLLHSQFSDKAYRQHR